MRGLHIVLSFFGQLEKHGLKLWLPSRLSLQLLILINAIFKIAFHFNLFILNEDGIISNYMYHSI